MDTEMLMFLSAFKSDIQGAAAEQCIELNEDAIAHALAAAFSTAKRKGFANAATRKAAAKRFVSEMLQSCRD